MNSLSSPVYVPLNRLLYSFRTVGDSPVFAFNKLRKVLICQLPSERFVLHPENTFIFLC
jgi:hypothetical protein